MNAESVYLHLPIPLQNLVIGLEGRRLQRRRYGLKYNEIEANAQERLNISVDRLQAYRVERLAEHLLSAEKSPFWRQRFDEYGIKHCSSDPFFELAKLPVLKKAEVKLYSKDICNPAIGSRELMTTHTSGTTGSGLIFVTTREMEQTTWATWWRYRHWHGIHKDNWCGYFGGRSVVPVSQKQLPYWRFNRSGRQILCSCYHLSEKTARDYAKILVDTKVSWIHGYPSMLALFADFVLEQGLTLPTIKVVTVGAENLLPSQKTKISSAFNAPVFQHYGQAEGVANISECPAGNLHVDEDYSGVEFLPIEGMLGTYRIIGTNWHNISFPLLRYDTGDLVTIDEKTVCTCGLSGRIVSSIDGRQEDYIYLANGVRVGRMDHVFKDMINIREAQIVQQSSGEIDVRVVRGNYYSHHDDRQLFDEFKKRLGNDIKISIHYVESLPRTQSGKLRFVIQE